MKNSNISKVFYAIVIALSFSMISCNNDDYDPTEGMIMYGETSDFYGQSPTPAAIRDAAVGKWYNDKGTLMLDIEKWRLNPNYPQTDQHEYEYFLSSHFEGYDFPNKYWNSEGGINKNNIYISGGYHLVVEGNQATLYIMRNTVEKVKVYKK